MPGKGTMTPEKRCPEKYTCEENPDKEISWGIRSKHKDPLEKAVVKRKAYYLNRDPPEQESPEKGCLANETS